MAISYVQDGVTLIRPKAYGQIKVQAANGGLATNGVVMIVGESDAGPRFSVESDLEANSFGPDQIGDVVAKYGSGPLVDAFLALTAPSSDAQITGGPSAIIPVKVNASTQATGTWSKVGGGTYATIKSKNYGKLENLIYQRVVATDEVLPTTGSFTYIPAVGVVSFRSIASGVESAVGNLSANSTPAAFVTFANALGGVAATGGAARTVLSGTSDVTIVAGASNTITVTGTGTWSNVVAGDTLIIPAGSTLAGGASTENVGAYVVTSANSTTLTATKLSDAGRTGASAGTVTAPVNDSVTGTGSNSDLIVYAPVTITFESATVVDGVGKSLEIFEKAVSGSVTDLFSRCAYVLGTATPVTWISKAGSSKLITSATEYGVEIDINRQVDGVQESFTQSGVIGLKLGYANASATAATLTISDTTLSTTITGVVGADVSISLSDFPTIADVVAYLNTLGDYSAAAGTAAIGNLPSTALDQVSATGILTAEAAQTGRVKIDSYKLYNQLTGSSLIQYTEAAAGLPADTAGYQYLSGGAKGGSASADFTEGLAALERVRGNFVVTLVSRDASADKIDGLTDTSSSYTVAEVNAALVAHINRMSSLKRQGYRQGFASIQTDFDSAKEAAGNIANARISMNIQDVKMLNSASVLTQFQPWMGAVVAAGMQAAGFYKAIFNKTMAITGILSADGSFDYRDNTEVEEALTSGLLVGERRINGGYSWISDQTTYQKDSNPVYNSIQAVYVGDVMALTCAERMTTAFVGQSLADVSANVAGSYMEAILADFARLKLIAPSDDAPKGYRNLSIRISGPVMVVTCELKLAGALYLIPITFTVTPISQSASL